MNKYDNRKSQFGQRKSNGSNSNNNTSSSSAEKPQEANAGTNQNPDQPNPNQHEQAQIVVSQESAANGQSDAVGSNEVQAKGNEPGALEGERNAPEDAGQQDGNSDAQKPKGPDEPLRG